MDPVAPSTLWSWRDFFMLAAWARVVGSPGVALVGFGRFMFPRVLFEPSPHFDAGAPDSYATGSGGERWKRSHRVRIVRELDGSFYAMLAICAQLGCTPNWRSSDDKFKRPCHGSGFKSNGTKFRGPGAAPAGPREDRPRS